MPEPVRADWIENPIDAFVLRGMEEFGLEPAPPADRATLLRRVTFDLTGLPPSPEDVEAFLADTEPGAFERVVDRLLDSPHYGERWGRHWLDVVRYADSDGYEYDDARPHAWRYRDWVIDALNADMPYDRFVREQVAGDELSPDDPEALVATGLHRLGPLRLNAGNQDEEKNRQEVLTEMTDMIGSAFLGLTIGCARCHDHKFDPIPQADYFRLQAFFAGTESRDLSIASEPEQREYEERMDRWKATSDRLRKELRALDESGSGEDPARRDLLVAEIDAHNAIKPEPPAGIMTVSEVESPAPATFILFQGEPGRHLDEVAPQFPGAIHGPALVPISATSERPGTAGRRASLARWLGDPSHPLTARVMVNRLWQHHFGRGLVATPNNFGIMGDPPTHPELLDWLAVEFAEGGFRLKAMHRLMVTSATYRQSSRASDQSLEEDPDNLLLSRMPRRRLEAEVLRDGVLAVAGTLNRTRGGPGVRLPLEPEVASQVYKGNWEPTPDPDEYTRRSIYLFVKRNIPLPFMEAFDAPDTLVSCGERNISIHAGQALALLNSALLDEQSRNFAGRLLAEVGPDPDRLAGRAIEVALSRPPRPEERERAHLFLEGQAALLEVEGVSWDTEGSPLPEGVTPALAAALSDLCLVLMNLDEFLYVD
ncbi:DUF1549 and DUF1553 domain-containing protein [Tautonia marina]|uniref:DUF1549 and DUF1553 domain-containing protein n=1 Tax=Tautonia marina TaxID=2653855 RepID=UPI00191BD50C|nr:DUF1549 and DUF1553 domain-containing protein [Tautonia marina]